MKRLFVLSALALAVGAAGLRLLQHDAGYVLIVVGGKTIEMRFWFAIFFIIVVSMLIWWLVRTILKTFHIFGEGWSLASTRRARKADLRTHRGLIHFIEGNWQDAYKDLLRAAKHVDQPLVHYLAAARSAYELGDAEQARKLIGKAEKVAPENDLAIALSQARMQLLDEKYEQCLATLHRARAVAPHHPVVLELLYKVYLGLHDWRALEGLLPELQRHHVLSPSAWTNLQRQIYFSLLAESASAGSKEERLAALSSLWQRMPKELHQSPPMIAAYCRCLLDAEQHEQVEPLLRLALKKQWDEELITLYGLTMANDRQQQLRWAERCLKDHPNDPALHLALGRICLRNELWGRARDYFTSAIQLRPMPAAYAELARLLAYLGEHKQSTDYYQQGLLLTTNGLPNLPMPAH